MHTEKQIFQSFKHGEKEKWKEVDIDSDEFKHEFKHLFVTLSSMSGSSAAEERVRQRNTDFWHHWNRGNKMRAENRVSWRGLAEVT